ncbi:MAG: glutamate--cysteine ligase [Gammaproteobacteria bacterium]|nr:glutamate--cysteine ligase [Gammaproteobacteria bacterium]
MKQSFEKRLDAIATAGGDILYGGLKGIEKESLRVAVDGSLSSLPHPAKLGSALTNRYITTDFSEALLEFVSPAFETSWEALQFICNIHQFTYANLGDEMLWSASMPCAIPADNEIPLARYGSSNVGQMKTIYRRGLGNRYGRQMQTIAGVHYNYSVPVDFWPAYQSLLGSDAPADEFRSEQYLGLIRNFRRMGWLVLYLFGASPALCKSFVAAGEQELESLNDDTYFEPFGTSLRMSDLGYSNQNQSRINISLNSLDEYVRDLDKAINTAEPSYEEIGVKVDGTYQQLNANLLQIENEFYSPVRPKRVARSGERPTAALQRGGIEYVEIRSLDINLFDPCGINQNTIRFMEAFLLYCLLQDSPILTDTELQELARNQTGTAKQGRNPDFRLLRDGEPVSVAGWADEILDGVAAVASQLDRHDDNDTYSQAVAVQKRLVANSAETPSARIVAELKATGTGFFPFALAMSRSHRDYFASITPLGDRVQQAFSEEVTQSLQRQRDIEASDSISLDAYLQDYFSAD